MESIQTLRDIYFWHNSLFAYGNAVLVFLFCFLLGKLFGFLVERKGKGWAARTERKIDDHLVQFISTFATMIGLFLGLFFLKKILVFPDGLERAFSILFTGIIIFFGAVAVRRIMLVLLKAHTEKFLPRREFAHTILPFFQGLISVAVWIIGILLFLSNIGVQVTSLLAGVGLGGLAFALAAKDTLGNLFASLSIFLDQPFKVGDHVNINSQEGKVLEIGVRSTRLQSVYGNTEYILPNSKVAESIIENVSKREGIRFDFMIGLLYENPIQNFEEAVKIVKEVLEKDPDVHDGYWVNLFEFAPDRMNIKVKIMVSLGPKGEYRYALGVRERVNFEILKRFDEANIELAFPRQPPDARKDFRF